MGFRSRAYKGNFGGFLSPQTGAHQQDPSYQHPAVGVISPGLKGHPFRPVPCSVLMKEPAWAGGVRTVLQGDTRAVQG